MLGEHRLERLPDDKAQAEHLVAASINDRSNVTRSQTAVPHDDFLGPQASPPHRLQRSPRLAYLRDAAVPASSARLGFAMPDWITSSPGVLGGKPCIRGTRISVEHVMELLASGANREDILRAHPQITPEGLAAALQYATRSLKNEVVWDLEVPA